MGEVEEEEQPSRHDMPAFPSGKAEGEGRSQRRQHAPVREPDGPGPVEAPLPGCRRLILDGGEIRPLPGKGQQVLPADLIRIVFQQQGPGTAVHRHAQYSRQ